MYSVKSEQFEGPLDLLLSLIEKEELDITQISLAKITGEYLKAIASLEGDSAEISEFLVVAAKLLYIKSKSLIPNLQTAEEEAEIVDLEEKLKEYQKYKQAAKHLETVLASEQRSFHKRSKSGQNICFTPPSNIGQAELFAIFADVMGKINEGKPEEMNIVTEKKVTLEEKQLHIRKSIKKGVRTSFRELMAKSRSKVEVIVTFLAILEMVKQREISVEQDSNFADFAIVGIK